MEALICRVDEVVTKKITVSGVRNELGNAKYTQRVIMPYDDHRICVWYNENAKGKERKIKLHDGQVISVRGTFIVVHEEYGAYGDITIDDIGVVMLAVED